MQNEWSELELIDLFAEKAGSIDKSAVLKGIGDDCAIFRGIDEGCWLITTDILVEDTHFSRAWHPPHLLGRKSIAVNLSDIAAMGGKPRFALMSIALSDDLDKEWIDKWSEGVQEILSEHKCALIGGDTARGSQLVINIVILGVAPDDQIVLRNAAAPGENIYVSGPLGSAAAGLEICRQPALFKNFEKQALQPLLDSHLNPEARVELGVLLGSSGLVGAMQDLSDGIATDLAHICDQSKVGAEIYGERLPGEDILEQVCLELQMDATYLKISGGEDYELLFTVRQGKDEELLNFLGDHGIKDIHRVGRIVKGKGVRLLTEHAPVDVAFQGYQHRGSG